MYAYDGADVKLLLCYGAWPSWGSWTRAKEISAWLAGQSGYELTRQQQRVHRGVANKGIKGRKGKDTVPLARSCYWSLFPLFYSRGWPVRVCAYVASNEHTHTQRPMYMRWLVLSCVGEAGFGPHHVTLFPTTMATVTISFFSPPPSSSRPSPTTYSIVSSSSTIYIRQADRPALTAEVAGILYIISPEPS